jgi:subtilase family serine protease
VSPTIEKDLEKGLFRVTVRNDGTKQAAKSQVRFVLTAFGDGTSTIVSDQVHRIGGLKVADTETLVFMVDSEILRIALSLTRRMQVEVIVDSDNAITEANEKNNSRQNSF